MAHTKRKNARPAQVRPRTTRSKGRPLTDVGENTQQLNEQLRALGLYAAPTLGDGNCLFRALSDQLYGSDSFHLKLRHAICNWISDHKDRYAPFVDDERGIDVHLQCMRQQGTYGGHLELSAFAHMTRRNVKVIQPGLVYVIEWNSMQAEGEDDPPSLSSLGLPEVNATTASSRDKRRAKREQKRPEKALPESDDESSAVASNTVYVAYHDWEHFSSIRNLRGPHAGLPNVREMPSPEDDDADVPAPSKPISKAKTKPASISKQKKSKSTAAQTQPASSQASQDPPQLPLTPSQIPLPSTRSPSPVSHDAPPPSAVSHLPPDLSDLPRRSSKRGFDESSASSEGSQSAAKRARSSTRSHLAEATNASGTQTPLSTEEVDHVPTDIEDTPSLTASNPGSPSSTSSLSSVPSREPSPEPAPPPPPMTRRQRKQAKLPKHSATAAKVSAGKIVIPGGRFRPSASKKDSVEGEGEWQKNGTGRLDVRGFRELKI